MYTPESIVEQQKDHINALVDAHWEYVEELILLVQEEHQYYPADRMLQLMEYNYKTVAKHFYKHGYEEAMKHGHLICYNPKEVKNEHKK